MSDIVVVSTPDPTPEPAASDTVVVVTDTATPTDPLLDIVTRLTRVEDGLSIVAATVAELDQRTAITQSNVEYVESQQAATEAVVSEVVEVVAEVAEPTTTSEPETQEDQSPLSKIHRFWAGKDKSKGN